MEERKPQKPAETQLTDVTVHWKGQDHAVWRTAYPVGGAPALVLRDRHTGEETAVASLNLAMRPPAGHIWIKDWNETTGVLPALVEARVVEDTGQRVPVGYERAALCKLLVVSS